LQDDGVARVLVENPGAERTTRVKEARIGERLDGGLAVEEEENEGEGEEGGECCEERAGRHKC
jgi:hypothetical protein